MSNAIEAEDGKLLFEDRLVGQRWKRYLEILYFGNNIVNDNNVLEKESEVDENAEGDEFEYALKRLNDKNPQELTKC